MEQLRIIHLSDLHFSRSFWHPSQFLNKRCIGNFNLLLFRRHLYQTDHLTHLPSLFKELEADHVCITGDFSSLSLDSEFELAKSFIKSMSQDVHCIPGNHDCYTKQVEKTKRFYDFFPSEELKNKRVEKKYLGNGWWWVGLDCTYATLPIYSYGKFEEATKNNLKKVLESISKDHFIILGNHFPLYPTNKPTHDLIGAKSLQELIREHKNIKLYLHGHDHGHYVRESKDRSLPLVFNSGSVSHKPNGTFYLIEVHGIDCLVECFVLKKEKDKYSWVIDWQKNFIVD